MHHILHCGYQIKWNHVASQLWAQFTIASRSQDFNGVWTRDLAIQVRRSNRLSYEATDVGSWSFLGSHVPVMSELMSESALIIYLKCIIHCNVGMKSNETMLPRSYERNFDCVLKPEKFRTSTRFEPVTSRYRCEALTKKPSPPPIRERRGTGNPVCKENSGGTTPPQLEREVRYRQTGQPPYGQTKTNIDRNARQWVNSSGCPG